MEVPCDSLQLHREVHLEGGGQLRLFMQAEACCGEAPEVALSILGHLTLLEGAQLTVSEGQGGLPERPSELCLLGLLYTLGTCFFSDLAFLFQTFSVYEAPSHLTDPPHSPLVTPIRVCCHRISECVSQ